MSIQVKGLKDAESFIKNKGENVYNNVNKAIIESGFYIESEVKESIAGNRAEHVSVDTGRFLNSVKNVQNYPLTSSIETNIAYAPFLEYGTIKFTARKHFNNTAKRSEQKIKEFIEKEIQKIL